jgi:translocation and assembly module TamA
MFRLSARSRRCAADAGRIGLAGLLISLATPATEVLRAANPQPYTVEIRPTGNGPLDSAVTGSSMLEGLRAVAPVGPFGLVARARLDRDRFERALQSYGFYDGHVTITIDRVDLDNPSLPARLSMLPEAQKAAVEVTLDPGPQYHLHDIMLRGDAPAAARQSLGIKPGAPAVAQSVITAQQNLLTTLQDDGYRFAKVGDPIATVVADQHAIDISMDVNAGPRVDLGQISIAGLVRTKPDYVRRRLLIHPGDRYDPRKLDAARQDLVSTGVFSTVRIQAADRLDPAGNVPVDVTVTEAPLRVVQFGISYETDLGGAFSASWTHRNLFGEGERLTLSAAVTGLGGTATHQPGYNFGATLAIPDWQRRDQTLTLNAEAVREYLIAYNRTALLSGVAASRKLGPDLTATVGVSGEIAQIEQEMVTRDYELLQAPLILQYDTTHDLLNPTHGLRASANLTPTHSFSSPGSTFLIAQQSGSAYIDFGTKGRSVLAVRQLIGVVEGATVFDIPPDQRFYAGGSGTVRGYKYQSIGPQFPDGIPIGGTAIDAGSVEMRQRIGASFGAVAFVDAGQVSDRSLPFNGRVDIGTGAGARYYTSFGPIRLDIAVPLVKQSGSGSFQLYIGIGQAF